MVLHGVNQLLMKMIHVGEPEGRQRRLVIRS
jgi:hypothetical protein